MSGSQVLLALHDVTKTYATEAETIWAVRGATLTATAGQFVCIYGPSGSGKSTLLNLMVGLDVADSGEIQADGLDVTALDEAARAKLRLETIGVVFQDDLLIEEFSVVENVALPLEARGVPERDAHVEAVAMLGLVGLDGLASRWPRQLSGGQRQRVGIARALVGGRKILVADEPTGALDTRTSTELFELIADLCGAGMLAIVCSHDPLCRTYADAVYEMIDGDLRATGA